MGKVLVLLLSLVARRKVIDQQKDRLAKPLQALEECFSALAGWVHVEKSHRLMFLFSKRVFYWLWLV